MQIILDLYQLKNICSEMSELGAANYAKRTTPAKDLVSQRKAYLEFGEARVKRWVRNGLVSSSRSGSTIRSKIEYSRAELMAANTAEKFNSIINK
nr:MAG TPA: hypothetical protein [Caudoviricetes sp.]